MIWGEQWVCPCGTHNLFLRKRCRDCGADRNVGAAIETVTDILQNFKGETMPEESLPNRGQASQVRAIMRDLVTAAGNIREVQFSSQDVTHGAFAALISRCSPLIAVLGRLEDLWTETLIAADREADTDFEAGTAFDLFWPEELPAPVMPLRELAPGERVEFAAPAGKFQCAPREGEPSFLLLGRDASADGLIDIWCEARRMLITLGLKPKSDLAKVIEAHNIGERMRQYRHNVEVEARMQRAGLGPPPDDGSAAHSHEHPQPD